jgi:hypothetical protein
MKRNRTVLSSFEEKKKHEYVITNEALCSTYFSINVCLLKTNEIASDVHSFHIYRLL